MVNLKPCAILMDIKCDLSNQDEAFSDFTLYQQAVGSLQYNTQTRQDVAYAMNKVAQYMRNPKLIH